MGCEVSWWVDARPSAHFASSHSRDQSQLYAAPSQSISSLWSIKSNYQRGSRLDPSSLFQARACQLQTIAYIHTPQGRVYRADKKCVTRMFNLSVRDGRIVHLHKNDTVCSISWSDHNSPPHNEARHLEPQQELALWRVRNTAQYACALLSQISLVAGTSSRHLRLEWGILAPG